MRRASENNLSLEAGGFGREDLLRDRSRGRAEAHLAESRGPRVNQDRQEGCAQQFDEFHVGDFTTRLGQALQNAFGKQLPEDESHLHHQVVVLGRLCIGAEGVLKPEPTVLLDIKEILDALASAATVVGDSYRRRQ